ncbi:RNA-binding protein Cwf29 [Dimargaris verticillata]|uniref:RNA-binding protein Cwf29 n=1 Tax=Dimargaris verticillata TaxID=2761393 RepID=A0A9W8BCB1_9FUNG|nr:RNA-binding protein Cwf29 [Dimargaris verticillata]
MNVIKEIQAINRLEIARNLTNTAGSWHDAYKDSAYIFIGGLDYELTEGDVICVFSQYGEILDVNLVRDKETGRSKGYAFLMYEDQRSTVLAVDNLNGIKVAGRTIRVDHVRDYRPPKDAAEGRDQDEPLGPSMNAAPPLLEGSDDDSTALTADQRRLQLLEEFGLDPEDPMADYYLKKLMKRANKDKKRKKKRAKHESPVHKEPIASKPTRPHSPPARSTLSRRRHSPSSSRRQARLRSRSPNRSRRRSPTPR